MLVSKKKKNLSGFTPVKTIAFSFLGIISIGTLLLLLPFSTVPGQSTSILTALFTATSATCVTGLVVVDTFSHWSGFGQVVILCLIQIGGLGLVTLVSFFNIMIGKKLGFRRLVTAQQSVSGGGIDGVKNLVRLVVTGSLFFEIIGALILMLRFVPKYGVDGISVSIFLAISAFCNAGFDILGREGAYSSLTTFAGDPVVVATIVGLIIIGGLGFVVWSDLLAYRKKNRLSFHSKVVLVTTGVLLLTGFIGFLVIEWTNPATLADSGVAQKLSDGFFQSVTTRTAGFNTIDTGGLTQGGKLLSMFLMFIGAAPGSTGGGIKVVTFTVILMTVVSISRGKSETEIAKRRVDKSIVYKALTIVILGLCFVFVTTMIINFTNDGELFTGINSMFESVSAFATVGLSTGITAASNSITRIALIVTMFVGRLGPVGFMLSVGRNTNGGKKDEVLPDANLIVG